MADDPKQVSMEELVVSNMYSIGALVRLLIEKGILDKEEILGKIGEIKTEHQQEREIQ